MRARGTWQEAERHGRVQIARRFRDALLAYGMVAKHASRNRPPSAQSKETRLKALPRSPSTVMQPTADVPFFRHTPSAAPPMDVR